MGDSNKGIWLVVALGIAAGIGIAVYYVTVAVPRADAKKTKKEVLAWTTSWAKTRLCLKCRKQFNNG